MIHSFKSRSINVHARTPSIRSTVRDFTVCLNTQYFSNIRDDLLPGYFQILISVQARGCEAVALASHGRFCNCSRQSNNWRKHIFMQASGLLEPRGAGGSKPRFLADHYQYLNPGGRSCPQNNYCPHHRKCPLCLVILLILLPAEPVRILKMEEPQVSNFEFFPAEPLNFPSC